MSAYEGTPSLGYLIALNRSPLTCHSLRTSILNLSCAAMIGQTPGHYQILEKIGVAAPCSPAATFSALTFAKPKSIGSPRPNQSQA